MRYIYKTTNTHNGRVYIGQRHIPSGVEIKNDRYLGSGTLLLAAIKKYGDRNFNKTILHVCETQEEADRLEIFEIAKHREELGRGMVYNMSPGGQYNRPDDHRETTSEAMKRFYANPENKRKYIERVNKKRIANGLKTLEELADERQKRREQAQEKRRARNERKQAKIKMMNDPEYIAMRKTLRAERCKNVFYRGDTLAAFRAGLAERSKNKAWLEKQRKNIGNQTSKQIEQAKRSAFGDDWEHYATIKEYAELTGIKRTKLDHDIRDNKVKPDARVMCCGKLWSFFDKRSITIQPLMFRDI